MRIFMYKSIIVFFGIYLTYNFTIGKKIDQYESRLMFLLTDQGREKVRNLVRKEIKNSIDNEFLLKNDAPWLPPNTRICSFFIVSKSIFLKSDRTG